MKKEEDKQIPATMYVTHIPENVKFSEHFSSLMLSSDFMATAMEVSALSLLTGIAWVYKIQVEHSKTLFEVAIAMWSLSLFKRIYNNYLEAVYCTYPKNRTQPVKEHALKAKKDLAGRDKEQLEILVAQDRLNFISRFCLDLFIYFMIPGFYLAEYSQPCTLVRKVLQLLLNHYFMSFSMYWFHRAQHKNPWFWKNIHSLHHWAKYPVSRTTYQDHWLDNFGMAVTGHIYAQILFPLDGHMFWFSRIVRVCESLEKHSGITGNFNLAYAAQQWLPFAAMPYHHDWHHEGYKGGNFSFAALGGIWDQLFGTRRTGRVPQPLNKTFAGSKNEDQVQFLDTSFFDGPYTCFIPIAAITVIVFLKVSMGHI
ncbi:hypothetical protein ACHWQZ_G003220 [Mnemiopsis leidyi]